MKISSLTINSIPQTLSNKKVMFKNNNECQPNIDKKDDSNYVKVPKWQYNLEQWVFGILGAITVFEIIDLVLNKRWK